MPDASQFRRFAPVGTKEQGIEGATLVSAAAIAPTHRIHHVSGTAEITDITLPWEGFAGDIVLIPADAFTGATGGTAGTALATAFTAVANRPLHLTYVPSSGLWYVHAIA